MKFSIRLLIAITLLVALAVHTYLSRNEVARLEGVLEVEQEKQFVLEVEAADNRHRTTIYEAALKSEEQGWSGDPAPPACYQLARERFQHLQQGRRP